MASIINIPDCASAESNFNTGVPLCDVIKGIPKKGIIFADKGKTFSAADCVSASNLISVMKTATTAARGSRIYTLWDLNNFEEDTPDPSTGSLGNLTTETIYISDPIPSFKVGYGGGELQHKRVSLMSGGSYDVFFVDDSYNVYGTATADGGLKGFSISQIFVYPSKFRISDGVNQYAFRIQLSSIAEYRENSSVVKLNAGLLAVYGLVNFELSVLSNSTNVYKIKAIADGGTDMEPLYGAAMAGLTWTAKNVQTGAAFTITSVADDTSLDAFTVTFDSTLYTALGSGDKIQLFPPTAALLAGANVKPYEGLSLVITK